MAKQPWFESWFDSPYYHILYKNRSYTEAAAFLDRLVQYLSPSEKTTMLDMACGNGRHSIHLAKLGYQVTGIDLAANSIKQALKDSKAQQLNNVVFKRMDMREATGLKFDYILNLFTSFGYFENEVDNLKVIRAMHYALNKNGAAVIDFLNAYYTKANLVKEETKTIDEVTFHINKKIEDGKVIKQIEFDTEGKHHRFEEKVQLLQLDHFKSYFKQVGFSIYKLFGNYELADFEEEKSDRLIMVIKPLF